MPEGGVTTRDHWTLETEAWELITYVNAAASGPMFAFGLFALSELIYPVAGFWL